MEKRSRREFEQVTIKSDGIFPMTLQKLDTEAEDGEASGFSFKFMFYSSG
jgi:hypothetical protein